MIQIKNLQKTKRVNQAEFRRFIKKVLSSLHLSRASVFFVLCDDSLIRKLNRRYFKRNRATDVIAFPLRDGIMPDFLGEVVISLETAVCNARFYRTRWQDEFRLYAVHGILHLLGYSDQNVARRVIMEKKQNKILKQITKRQKVRR